MPQKSYQQPKVAVFHIEPVCLIAASQVEVVPINEAVFEEIPPTLPLIGDGTIEPGLEL